MPPDSPERLPGTRLDRARYLEAMDADLDTLAAAAAELGRDVPSCPGWTVRDLVSHVIGVYRHKIVALETDAQPPQRDDGWGALDPDDDPAAVLRATYADLRALLVARPDSAPTWSWWPAEQTVGFWVRRMAHETAVHRWDAEGATLGVEAAGPIDDDLAIDGADELLGWLTWEWPEDMAQQGADGQRVQVSSLDHDWVVTLRPTVAEVEQGTADDVVAMLAAAPSDLVLHLWGRPVDGIATTGDLDALRLLRERLSASTD
jgi:uncharacterized protein (TIGR03083 family)